MEIELEYELFDEVWVMSDNKPKRMFITGIMLAGSITHKEDALSSVLHTKHKTRVEYLINESLNNIELAYSGIMVNESLMFKSKQKLIDSL